MFNDYSTVIKSKRANFAACFQHCHATHHMARHTPLPTAHDTLPTAAYNFADST